MAYTSINSPTDYFNTKLWTGDGNTTQAITGVNFQPDLVWEKGRSLVSGNLFFDAIRGANVALVANNSNAEVSVSGYINSFDSDGFTVGNDGAVNGSGDTYVAWNWLASNTTASNTDGSITSTVSANTTSGFSIVSYTGTGSNATVGHGLGAVPKVIIIKDRTTAYGWSVYHASVGNTAYLRLDKTDATTTDSTFWQNTTPTSSVFSIGTSVLNNTNTDNHIAYCFAEKKGYSKFGSYTGNGSTNGPMVYTGFKPAFLIVKRYDSTNNWYMYNNKVNPFNETNRPLKADTSEDEATIFGGNELDFLSNGFKLKDTINGANGSGASYIYMAFAESPFTTSTGVPTTAR